MTWDFQGHGEDTEQEGRSHIGENEGLGGTAHPPWTQELGPQCPSGKEGQGPAYPGARLAHMTEGGMGEEPHPNSDLSPHKR